MCDFGKVRGDVGLGGEELTDFTRPPSVGGSVQFAGLACAGRFLIAGVGGQFGFGNDVPKIFGAAKS